MATLVDVVQAGRLSYADAEEIVASLAKLYDAATVGGQAPSDEERAPQPGLMTTSPLTGATRCPVNLIPLLGSDNARLRQLHPRVDP